MFLRRLCIPLLALGWLTVTAASAFAVPLVCDSTTGTPGSGECRITTLHNLGAGGTFEVDRTLRIFGPGAELRTNGGSTLTLNIAGGSPSGLIIELGGKITGNTTGTTGIAATLNINVANGNILLADSGATISAANTAGGGCGPGRGGVINLTANGNTATITTEDGTTISVNGSTCTAGAINILAPNNGSIDIDGDVLSQSGRSGSGSANSNDTPPLGGTQQPGGGPIFITASCNLTISDTGFVSSRGQDPGADLVHLQGGCDVLINGLVESTGAGHAVPGNPPTSCSNVIPRPGSVRRNPATRPGKPFDSVACVEVWAGNILTINKDSAGNNGEINADTGNGGSTGTSWIDLFARGDIRILNSTAQWAVHANGTAGTDNGGVVTVKTQGTGPVASPGNVILNGLALQASAASHGPGGTVDVQSTRNVDMKAIVGGVDGSVQAKGGVGAPADDGGHIILFSQVNILAGALSNLNVTGAPNVGGATGVVDLQACGTIDFPPGTITPAGATVTKLAGTCPPAVTFPTAAAGQYDIVLPNCGCGGLPPGDCEKAAVKAVINPVTGRFPGNKGPDVLVRLDLGQTVQNAVNTATDSNADGYIIVLVVKDSTGLLGGSTTENVVISKNYAQRFALLACSVTINAKDKSLAAGRILGGASSPAGSPENIFVMDLHGARSGWSGWYVEGNNRYLRNVANSGNAVGVWIVGSNNTFHNGNANNNKVDGILVNGNGNVIDSSDAFGNGGSGVTVVGSSNKVLKVDAGDKGKGNGGDGVKVSGNSNAIQEASAFSNTGNGVFVNGNSNTLLKNDAGDKGKGNGGDGIKVVGSGNKLQENAAFANRGDGFDVGGGSNTYAKNTGGDRADKANGGAGFRLSGGGSVTENKAIGNSGGGFQFLTSGFALSKNVSGNSGSGYANSGFQYRFAVSGNVNSGGNKSNNVTLAGTPFAAGDK